MICFIWGVGGRCSVTSTMQCLLSHIRHILMPAHKFQLPHLRWERCCGDGIQEPELTRGGVSQPAHCCCGQNLAPSAMPREGERLLLTRAFFLSITGGKLQKTQEITEPSSYVFSARTIDSPESSGARARQWQGTSLHKHASATTASGP